MDETITAYPLAWPSSWARKKNRERARFGKCERQYLDGKWIRGQRKDLSISQGTERILSELSTMGIPDYNVVISTNLDLRRDGLPRSAQRDPDDPGVAVYWRHGKETRCMAVDMYDRVADNLAAVAATLDAMRAIKRHGGSAILDRAFIGFKQLAAPEQWWQVLGLDTDKPTREQIEDAWMKLAKKHHPDVHGEAETQRMARINAARDRGLDELTA